MKPMTWLESWFLRSGRGVLRMVAGRYFGVPQSGEPTATSEFRAALFVEPGAAGVADELKVCLKDGADAYSWVTVGVAGGVYTDEMARDAIGTALVAGNNIDITVNDSGNTITVAVETLTLADITDVTSSAAELNVLDGVPATLTATELGYVDGVTSAIQTQLDAKQPLDADLTTIAGLADPNADRMLFWDDSAGAYAYLAASTGLTITTTNMTVRTASATQTGIVELATDAETTTGTDTTRAITPANFTSQIGTRVPALAHTHAAADIASGTIATARLGSGTANSSSYLRGDQTWDTIGIDELNDVAIATPAQGQLLTYDAGSWVNADPQQGIMTLDDRTHAYVSQFGTTGTGNTNFDTPTGIGIDSSGDIYVADRLNARVKKHDSSGTYVTAQGSVTDAGALHVAADDDIYVSRRNAVGDYRIRNWSADFGVFEGDTPNISMASAFEGITTAGFGLYATNGSNIYRFNISGIGTHLALTNTYGSSGSGDGQFANAKGITTDGTYLYVCDSGNQRIQKLTLTGAYIAQWGRSGSDPGEFSDPVAIHYNSVTGMLYVVDAGRDDVQEFTTTGGFVGSFGAAGTGNGEFQTPAGIANDVAGSSVWVTDTTQDRLQKFTRSVTSEEATRIALNPDDFIVASTDGGETAYVSFIRAVDVPDHGHTEPGDGGVLPIGLTYITGGSFSAVSSFSVNNCFTSDYRNYRLVFNIDSATAAAQISMRMRVGGSDHSSANYERFLVSGQSSANTVTGFGATAQTSLLINAAINGALDEALVIDVFNPEVSNKTAFNMQMSFLSTATTTYQNITGGGGMRVTTSFDGFSLLIASGNFTGAYRVYGYRNS